MLYEAWREMMLSWLQHYWYLPGTESYFRIFFLWSALQLPSSGHVTHKALPPLVHLHDEVWHTESGDDIARQGFDVESSTAYEVLFVVLFIDR